MMSLSVLFDTKSLSTWQIVLFDKEIVYYKNNKSPNKFMGLWNMQQEMIKIEMHTASIFFNFRLSLLLHFLQKGLL